MAATISVQAMCNLMVKARLKDADQVKSIFQNWSIESRQPDDAEHFRRFLVEQGHATEYQATLLAHGRTEGYFLGRYRIVNRIGQGSRAGVYEAYTPEGQRAALKVLPPSKAKNPQLLARFQRESKLVACLNHPNVVRGLECGESLGLFFIALEFLEGETLDEVLKRRGRLSVAEAVLVIFQALQGLQYLHEQNMVHRDLKPANLMLIPGRIEGRPDTTRGSIVKILDIGLGRQVFDENAKDDHPESQLTAEGVLLGTPDYWSPEQARSAHDVDIRGDIYSLGCVLYHSLTGQPPFADAHLLNQIIRHVTEEMKPARSLNPEVPDGLQQVLSFMMAKEPSQRYPTPERAARALQLFLPIDEPVAVEPAEERMSEKPSKPPADMSEIPKGKLVSGNARGEKAAAKPKPRPPEPAPSALPAAAPPQMAATPGEFDVELVAIPAPPPVKPKRPGDKRSLLELDSRDFIMLGAGVVGTILAVLMGLVLAKAIGGKKPEATPVDGDNGRIERPEPGLKPEPSNKAKSDMP